MRLLCPQTQPRMVELVGRHHRRRRATHSRRTLLRTQGPPRHYPRCPHLVRTTLKPTIGKASLKRTLRRPRKVMSRGAHRTSLYDPPRYASALLYGSMIGSDEGSRLRCQRAIVTPALRAAPLVWQQSMPAHCHDASWASPHGPIRFGDLLACPARRRA